MKALFLLVIVSLLLSCSENETAEKNITISPVETVVTDGEYVDYHPNGQIKTKGILKNNKREGQWAAYYDNGTTQSENKYENGILNGKTATYYPNGNLHYAGLYINDKKDGNWYFYLENGTLDKEVLFSKGEKIKVTP